MRPRAAGGADVLLRRATPSDERTVHARLEVVGISAGGRLRVATLRGSGPATRAADLARTASGRLVVAWSEGLRLRIADAPDGRTFGTPRTVRRGTTPIGIPHALDLAVGTRRSGGAVLVVSEHGRDSRGATTAMTVDRAARVTRAQIFRKTEGLLTTTQTAGGRVGLAIEDTGITGERGECTGDGGPRRILATVLEPSGQRFRAPRELDRQARICSDAGPRLLAGRGEALTVVWGATPDAAQGVNHVASAAAPSGQGFGAPATVAAGRQLWGAALDPRDGVLVTTLATPDPRFIGGRGIEVRRAGAPATALTPTGATAPLAVDAAGRALVAWTELGEAGLDAAGWRLSTVAP